MNKINYINDNIAQGLLANEIVVIGHTKILFLLVDLLLPVR